MKKLLILSLSVLFFACNMAPKVDYVVFSGKVENPSGDKVTISKGTQEFDFELAEDGTWSDTIKVESGYFRFDDTNESSEMYLEPGYNLYLTLNTEQFDETIKYEGAGSGPNNFLAAKYLLDESLDQGDEFYKMDEGAAQAYLDDIKAQMMDLMEKQQDLPSDFVEMEKRNISYSVEGKKIYYAYYHPKVTGEEYEASEEFMAEINGLDVNLDVDYELGSYRFLVGEYHENKMDEMASVSEKLEYIGTLQNPKVKSSLVGNFNYELIPGGEYNEAIVAAINEYSDNEKLKEIVAEKAAALDKLIAGNASPQFSYEDVEGNMVSLEDFKGQYVYLDVWATWCGPCRREIPYLKELEEEYSDRNIAFVGVSIDKNDDKQKWLDFVAEKELVGTQVFSDSDWSSEWVKAYAIYSIPRFILVDPDGNIVDAMAPRPSDKSGIKALLDEQSI